MRWLTLLLFAPLACLPPASETEDAAPPREPPRDMGPDTRDPFAPPPDAQMVVVDGGEADAAADAEPDVEADSGLTDERCFAAGEERSCDDPTCPDGVQVCVTGRWSLCRPPEESCDGRDNDCDGTTDEGLGLGEPCSVGVGACLVEAVMGCGVAGVVECAAAPGRPAAERCDALDNDCDGRTDEDTGLGQPCSVGVGACAVEGERICDEDGATTCDVEPGAVAVELCDELDNDCDGRIDEDLNLGAPCEVGEGVCVRVGALACGPDGVPACDAEPGPPAFELCDELDNDCDGVADEGFDLGEVCEVGEDDCVAEGVIVCTPGGEAACNAMPGAPEKCDDLDNDCDGETDEGFDVGAECVVGGGVCRADGFIECTADGEAICDAAVDFEIDLGDGSDGALVVEGEVVLEPRRYQLTSLTVMPGGVLRGPAWDGEAGGALDLVISGRAEVMAGGRIDMSGRGFRGGAPNPKIVHMYVNQWTNGGGSTGFHGEGPGGGGGGWAAPQGTVGAGGGGGHAAAGADGTPCGADARGNYSVWDVNDEVSRPIPMPLPRFSSGGVVNGDVEILDLPMGSGGGSGGNNYDGGADGIGGAGGVGGGAIRIAAGELIINGDILSNGTTGQVGAGGNYVGGGGGGAGGSIYLIALSLNHAGAVSANGAAGGNGMGDSNGGAGAAGRVRVDAGESMGAGGYAPQPGLRGELACGQE